MPSTNVRYAEIEDAALGRAHAAGVRIARRKHEGLTGHGYLNCRLPMKVTVIGLSMASITGCTCGGPGAV
jgi:hypothetical protein